MTYAEFFFYSPILDTDAVRISMWAPNGGEFFRILPVGKKYRDRRNEAIELIETAIRQGLEPGEVLPA